MINSRKYKKKSKSFLSRRFFKIEIFFFFFLRLSISSNEWYLNECKLTLLKIGIQVSFRTIVRDARLIPEKRTKWRDVLLLGVAVSLFMLLVSLMIRPIGVYQIIQSTLSCFLSACTRFGFHPLVLVVVFDSSCCVFSRRNLSFSVSRSSCIFLVFPFFTLTFLDERSDLKNHSLS